MMEEESERLRLKMKSSNNNNNNNNKNNPTRLSIQIPPITLQDLNVPRPLLFIIQFLPSSIQHDLDKTFVCAFLLCGILICETITIPFSIVVFLSNRNLSLAYLGGSWGWIILPSLLLFLCKTGKSETIVNIVLGMIFSVNTTRSIMCNGYLSSMVSPIRILPLMTAFLSTSPSKIVFCLISALALWIFEFFSTPFPSQMKCVTREELYGFRCVIGVILLVLTGVMGFMFIKANEIKQRHLELERNRCAQLTQAYCDFTRIISHEIRTPLFTIMGLIELMYHDPRTKCVHKDTLKNIMHSSENLNSLLSRILDFSSPTKEHYAPPCNRNDHEKNMGLKRS